MNFRFSWERSQEETSAVRRAGRVSAPCLKIMSNKSEDEVRVMMEARVSPLSQTAFGLPLFWRYLISWESFAMSGV